MIATPTLQAIPVRLQAGDSSIPDTALGADADFSQYLRGEFSSDALEVKMPQFHDLSPPAENGATLPQDGKPLPPEGILLDAATSQPDEHDSLADGALALQYRPELPNLAIGPAMQFAGASTPESLAAVAANESVARSALSEARPVLAVSPSSDPYRNIDIRPARSVLTHTSVAAATIDVQADPRQFAAATERLNTPTAPPDVAVVGASANGSALAPAKLHGTVIPEPLQSAVDTQRVTRNVTAETGVSSDPAVFSSVTGKVPSTPSGSALPHSQSIATPVQSPEWGQQISERVLFLAGNQVKTAEVRLTPAELGPLRVQVTIEDGATNVTFHAQHAATREAIEMAMPRLRELLADNGLSLGQANVAEQDVSKGQRESAQHGSSETTGDNHDESADQDGADAPAQAITHRVVADGLVDTFA